MTFRAAWTLNDGLSTTATTATGTVPATVQTGDVLAVVAVENTGTNTYTIAGGGTGVTWHLRSGPDDNAASQRTYVWTATAVASSAGSTVTVTSTGGSRFIGAGFAGSSISESSILIALTTDTTSDTSLNWPSVTIPAGGNAWELYSLATFRASTVPNLTTPPSGSVRDAKAATAFGNSPQFCALALHQTAPVPAGNGSTSFGTATADIAVTNQLYTIAFQTTATSTSSTATGAVALGGTITAKAAATATGSITLGGAVSGSARASATGTVTLGGTATASGPAAATAAGSVALSGAATAKAAATATGTVTLGGTAAAKAPATATGGVTIGGSDRGQGPTRDVTVTWGPVTTRSLLTAPAARTLTAAPSTRILITDPQE